LHIIDAKRDRNRIFLNSNLIIILNVNTIMPDISHPGEGAVGGLVPKNNT
jgi:hypothetical protein